MLEGVTNMTAASKTNIEARESIDTTSPSIEYLLSRSRFVPGDTAAMLYGGSQCPHADEVSAASGPKLAVVN
jgi:hypothetical protein